MERASWDTTFMAFAVAEHTRARSRLELIAEDLHSVKVATEILVALLDISIELLAKLGK